MEHGTWQLQHCCESLWRLFVVQEKKVLKWPQEPEKDLHEPLRGLHARLSPFHGPYQQFLSGASDYVDVAVGLSKMLLNYPFLHHPHLPFLLDEVQLQAQILSTQPILKSQTKETIDTF